MLHKLRKALCFSVNIHGCEEIKLEGKTAENIIFLSYRPVWFRFIIVCNICNLKEDKVKALTGAIICISSYLARFSLSTHTHHCHFFATWHYQMCLRMKAFKCTSVLKEKAFPHLEKSTLPWDWCGKSRSVFWRSDLTNHVKLPSLFASHIVLAFIMPGEKPLNVILSNPMCLHMPIYLNEAFVLLFFFFYRSRVLSFYKYEFYI